MAKQKARQPQGVAAAIPPENRLIELEGISKSFGPVVANKDISLIVERGSIHGIVGENGAGKSTLMSILYGLYSADAGIIRMNGAPLDIRKPQDAIRAGIGMVHQHFMLVERFSVLDNIILGAEKGFTLGPTRSDARRKIAALADEYNMQISLDAIAGELSVGLQQRVEILKALHRDADLLILDEPTGVLTPKEASHLFAILRKLRDEGKTIIIITHKLQEIMAITDSVSVMRRGEMSPLIRTSETNPQELARLMVGRDVMLRIDKAEASLGAEILRVDGLSHINERGVKKLDQVSFTIKAGEILGVAGVAGNGQSELLEILAGMRATSGGAVDFKGAPLEIGKSADPSSRRKKRIGHVPEDRQRAGLIGEFRLWENSSFGFHNFARFKRPLGGANQRLMREEARGRAERFDIRPPDIEQKAWAFSGGNQQKIVLAREIGERPELLLIGQPTRGVDIGAIEFIHREIINMRDLGAAILLVSVELEEILSLSDRIIVMLDGKIMGEREAARTNEDELGLFMAGVGGVRGAGDGAAHG